MNRLLILLCLLIVVSCQQKEEVKSDLVGLGSPIALSNGENEIDLLEYFMDGNITSASSDIGLDINLNTENKTLKIYAGRDLNQPLSIIDLQSADRSYQLLAISPRKKPVQLKLADKDYDLVQIKGEMNAWNIHASPMRKENGNWLVDFELNPGNYQYKFVADGKELNDPLNANEVSNGSGGTNSLLSVPQPDKAKLPWLTGKSTDNNKVTLALANPAKGAFVLWQNQLLKIELTSNTLSFTIPAEAKKLKRSTLRCYAYNDEGISNNLTIPVEYGKVLTNPADIDRNDYRAQIMYFTLVDRFNNGDTSIDDPVNDPRLKQLTDFMGGDLKGITDKIKDGYFDSLNVNALWLSPITQNPLTAYQEYIYPQYFYSGYHGYWPISSSKVDHRFGDDQALHNLVDAAHEKDINVFLDYVTNHVHEEHPMYQRDQSMATELMLPEGKKNLRLWDEQRLTTWFDNFMPSLDLSDPEVIEMQSDSTIFWLKKFGLDGYRHDATKHIPLEFWKTLTRKLKEQVIVPEDRTLYQIGETYGSRELISSYIGSGMLDSQFDFNLYFDARGIFAIDDASFIPLAKSMQETFNYYGYHSTMGYITGNHDQARFISLASGDVRFDEDHKMAGFNRDIQISDKAAYKRLEMLVGFVMTIPGVPVIYYGDEIGMPGAGDPDSRRMMRFDGLSKEETETKKMVETLTQLRKDHLSLTYGHTDIMHSSDNMLIYKRTYFGEESIVVFNKSSESKSIPVNINNSAQSSLEEASMKAEKWTIAPHSFDILISKS